MKWLAGIGMGFLLGWSSLYGQQPIFKTHQAAYPLQDLVATRLIEASSGFIWLGTEEGLFRYDGYQFVYYERPDQVQAAVRALYEDAARQVWVGYNDGYIAYSTQNGHLKPWDIEEGHPAVPVTGFAEDAAGNFWIATYGEGLYYHNGIHLFNLNEDDDLPASDVYDMTTDLQKRVWVGTDGGLSMVEAQEEQKRVRTFTQEDGLSDLIVQSLLLDPNGNFWLGTHDGGLCYFRTDWGQAELVSETRALGSITSMLLYIGRELWIGTESAGLWRYSLETDTLARIESPDFRGNTRLYDLLKDSEGNSWVLGRGLGIRSANRQTELFRIPEDMGSIQSVWVDYQETIWVGTNTGIYRKSVRGSEFEQVYTIQNAVCLYEQRPGEIWAGTFDRGLWLLQTQSGTSRQVAGNGLTQEAGILSISGNDSTLWVASIEGVYKLEIPGQRYNETSSLMPHRKDNLPSFLYKIMEDSGGRLWLASDGDGVYCMNTDNSVLRYTTSDDGSELGAVYAIVEDNRGIIWISTAQGGIFYFSGEGFTPVQLTREHRSKPYTTMVSLSQSGMLLLIREGGVDLLNPETQHVLYRDLILEEPGTHSSSRSTGGLTWFGSGNRLYTFTELKEPFVIHPRVCIKGVELNFNAVDFTRRSTYSHDENNLAFQYVGLWYAQSEVIQYRYKLEGFDPAWIYSRDLVATYSRLPPGTYTFVVQATENDRFSDEPIDRYQFTIKPAWWQSPLFYTGVIALLFSLGWGVIRRREKLAQARIMEEREEAERQFELLRSQMNPHFLFNSFNTLIALIEENSPDAVQFTEQLADYFRSMLTYRNKQLIPLQEEFHLVMLYGELLRHRFQNRLILSVPPYPDSQNQTYVVPFAVQLLVENAVKHNVVSIDKPLHVRITYDSTSITVSNNLQKKQGSTIDSTGFGLQSIIRQYKVLSKNPVLVNDTGTEFRVSIPLILNRDHTKDEL